MSEAKAMSGLDGVSPYQEAKDLPAQVLVLRQERDLARSEAELMERMYHGGLGTMENYMKLNRALSDWQQANMPAVRAVREILRQRPELRGPDGIVNAILKGSQPSDQGACARPPRESESVCVGEMVAAPDGAAHLRCNNCNVLVAKLSQAQLAALHFPNSDGLQQHWEAEWAAHTASKGSHLTPALSPSGEGVEPTAVITWRPGLAPVSDEDEDLIQQCIEIVRTEQKAQVALLQRRLRLGYTRAARIMDELQRRGLVGPAKGIEDREILMLETAATNPNAGVKQAYPKGRFSR